MTTTTNFLAGLDRSRSTHAERAKGAAFGLAHTPNQRKMHNFDSLCTWATISHHFPPFYNFSTISANFEKIGPALARGSMLLHPYHDDHDTRQTRTGWKSIFLRQLFLKICGIDTELNSASTTNHEIFWKILRKKNVFWVFENPRVPPCNGRILPLKFQRKIFRISDQNFRKN